MDLRRGKHRNLSKRLRYYQGNIDLDLISKGEYYNKLAKAILFLYVLLIYLKKEDINIPLKQYAKKIII